MKKSLIVAAMLAAAAMLGAVNASAETIGVDVQHGGDDRVGVMLVSEVRSALVRTGRFHVDSSSPLEIRFATLDPIASREYQGLSTAAGISFTFVRGGETLYLGGHLFIVGRSNVQTMAAEIVAALDKALTTFAERIRAQPTGSRG